LMPRRLFTRGWSGMVWSSTPSGSKRRPLAWGSVTAATRPPATSTTRLLPVQCVIMIACCLPPVTPTRAPWRLLVGHHMPLTADVGRISVFVAFAERQTWHWPAIGALLQVVAWCVLVVCVAPLQVADCVLVACGPVDLASGRMARNATPCAKASCTGYCPLPQPRNSGQRALARYILARLQLLLAGWFCQASQRMGAGNALHACLLAGFVGLRPLTQGGSIL
jgi:hypothetical protein